MPTLVIAAWIVEIVSQIAVLAWLARRPRQQFRAFKVYFAVEVGISILMLAMPDARRDMTWVVGLPFLLLFRFLAVLEVMRQAFDDLHMSVAQRGKAHRWVRSIGLIIGGAMLFVEIDVYCQPSFWVQQGLLLARWANGMDLTILILLSVGLGWQGVRQATLTRRHRQWLTLYLCAPLISALFVNSFSAAWAKSWSPTSEMSWEILCCAGWIWLFARHPVDSREGFQAPVQTRAPALFAEGVDVGVQLALQWMEAELAHSEPSPSVQKALDSIRWLSTHAQQLSYLQNVVPASSTRQPRSQDIISPVRTRAATTQD